MSATVLSPEADQFFTSTPPKLGGVVRVQATTSTTGAPLVQLDHATTGLTEKIVGKLIEVWASADATIALHTSATGTIAAAGTLGTTSGSTIKANERRKFFVPPGRTFLFAVTAASTSNLEIYQASAKNLEDFVAGL